MEKIFRPVQGLDEKILKMGYSEGYLYMATDSGKIYLDANNKNKILMGGGGASILYGNDDSVNEMPNGTYILSISTLEDSANIKIGDLVINQKDGKFYKIKMIDVENDKITCDLVAISGTGGGSSSGPGGSESNITVKIEDIANSMAFVYGEPAYIKVTPEAVLDATVLITYEIIGNNNNKVTYFNEIQSAKTDTFDIGSKLFEGINKVNITIEGNNSGSATRSYTSINSVRLSITPSKDLNPFKVIEEDERSLNFVVQGTGIDKKIEAYIDGKNIYSNTISENNYTVEVVLPGAKIEGAENNDERWSHGVHEVKIVMSASVNGRTIYVPELIYEFAWVESGNTTPIIWFGKLPTTIIDYTVAAVEYMVYDPSYTEGRSFTIKLLKEGEELPESPFTISYDSTKFLTWNISNYTIGNNEYTINRNGIFRSFEFVVEADTSRNMNILTTNLYLSLDSQGRSNNEASYNRDKWIFTNNSSQTFEPVFNNFNWYNNGWIEDERGISALRISNGASLDIPLDNVLKNNALPNSWTFEFQFKIRNVQNYLTMVNTSVSEGEETEEDKDNDGIPDKEVIDSSTVKQNWNEIAFANFYRNGVGFAFGPSDFFMSGGGSLAWGRYKEDKLINISIVLNQSENLIYLYINGILSQIKECDSKSGFSNQTSVLNFSPLTCDIDLYKVRIYKRALNYSEVVHNILADLKDVLTYDINQITKTDNYGNVTIDLLALERYNLNNPDNPSMPYAILKINDSTATKLPYYKGGKVNCDVTFVNPALDRAYETGELKKVAAAAGLSVEDYYLQHCPSFHKIQAQVDVQGTSSQGYPRRNYKLKCKPSKYGGAWTVNRGPFTETPKEIKEICLDNFRGEPTFTWKADYMESSGTHNTGFASYVKTLYSKHPLLDYYDESEIENYNDLRTTIYGFPMLVFEQLEDGTYEFIGKYNFNLDKDCPNVTGMEFEKEHPYVPGKLMSEVCECWEMCNNKGTRTAFKQLDYDEIIGEKIDESGSSYIDYTLTLPDDIEYRYLSDGDSLEDLLKNPSIDNNKKALEYYKNIQSLAEWLYWLDTNPTPGADNDLGSQLETPMVYDSVTYEYDTAEYRLAKFKNEFNKHFDLEYMLVYFILTELLVLYDSRGKNMMLASWGPQEENGEYIWYPIFYDVDTQLGIDNSGVPLWDYDINPTESRVFSTPGSVMWNNFFATYLVQIKNKYKELRGNALSFEKLNGYYTFDSAVSNSYAMKGIRPYIVYNADAFYKYIAPALPSYGYITTEGEIAYTDTYYYCAQGTRDLQRELFLNNRFYYLDSKWQAGAFAYENIGASTMVRINANSAETSDTIWQGMDDLPEDYEYPNEYDTLNWINITPFLNSYAGIYIDNTFISSGSVSKAGETAQVTFTDKMSENIINGPNDNQGQIIYLSGKKYISSYGDLSRYYLNEIDLTNANKLLDITFGSDLENYKNNYFKKDAKITLDETIGYPLLKEANFGHLSNYNNNINLSFSEKLENFRALGSSITGVQFSEGVQLKNCYLPKTINNLILVKANNLTNILTEYPNKNYDTGIWPNGLYIEGLTNKLEDIENKEANYNQVAVNLSTCYLDNQSLGLDSYKLLKGLVGIKQQIIDEWLDLNDSLNPNLFINVLNVDWSPYEKIESGAVADSNLNYYYATDQYTYQDYIYSTQEQWNIDTLNGRVYYLKDENLISPITDLALLDTFIDSYLNNGTFYGSIEGTIPYISGSIYVNNTADTPISEIDIQNKYLYYYPELTIYAAYTTPALTIKYLEEASNNLEIVWSTQKYDLNLDLENTKVNSLNIAPNKTHYDFVGWSLNKEAIIPDEKQPADYTLAEIQALSEDGLTLTFWAVYEIHKYKMKFYNYDGSSLLEDIIDEVDEDGDLKTVTLLVPAENSLYAPTEVIPYRSDELLGKMFTYTFEGYSFSKNNIGPIVNLETIKSSKDLMFYAYYEIINVKENIHPEYFIATNKNYNESSTAWGNSEFDIEDGVTLKLNYPVKGKITIPSTYNGKKVVAIDNTFSALHGLGENLTYVFFEEDTEIRVFEQSCFEGKDSSIISNLIEVELPNSLRRIDAYCFRDCNKLNIPNNTIGNNIAYIGNRAFIRALDSNLSGFDLIIGSNVKKLNYFGNINPVVGTVQIGEKDNWSQLDFSDNNNNDNPAFIFSQNTETITIILYSNKYSEEELSNYCRLVAKKPLISVDPGNGS